uniref:Uncharacterized protein n=1 Tax=Rhizophora mucronata TaxID=61149 RepID=A0A2P2N798_RHIMU
MKKRQGVSEPFYDSGILLGPVYVESKHALVVLLNQA